MADLAGIAQRFDVVRGVLEERSRRLVAAAESVAAGRGGVSVVARATGMSRQVIRQGLRELAEQNLAKAHYLASGLAARFKSPFFNEFVVRVGDPEALNKKLLKKKVIGGLALGRFYPELADCMLLCATEMTKRESMDIVRQAVQG